MQIVELINATRHLDRLSVEAFHELRVDALTLATEIFNDRQRSYGEATDELAYGSVSLADEIFKRAKRMKNMCDPTKGDLEAADLTRLEDVAIDLINFASWQYALIRLARKKTGEDTEHD